MRLRTKFAIALLVVMLVLSSVVLGSLQLFRQQTVAGERTQVNETATLTARQIDAVADRRKDEIGNYAATEVDDFNDTGAYLPRFVAQSNFYAAKAVAPNGTVVDFRGAIPNETRRREEIGDDVGDRQYIRDALNGSTVMTDVERFNDSDLYVVKMAAPIGRQQSISDPDFEGVLVGAAYVNVGQFFRSTRTIRTSAQSVAVYSSIDGEPVTLLQPEKSFAANISATATVGNTGWTVRVSRDRSLLADRLQTLVGVQAVSLLFVLGAVVGLGLWEYRTNLSQTEKLLDAFTALQRGDYDREVSLTAAEEWEQISDGFNEMAGGIKEREREIRERGQRLGVLNRVLRHNLQNDMSVILNYAEMVPEFDDPAQERMAVDKIVEKGRGLLEHGQKARNIEDAMESAEEGLMPVDAAAMTRDAVAEFESEYPDVTVESHVPEKLEVEAISAFDYAIDNVVENAFEHNDAADPEIEVVLTEDGDEATLSVMDDGPGIPDYELQIFDQEEETALEHGSGIGLWLIYWVVEKSAGELGFGEGIDGGATVSITVDLYEEDTASDETDDE